MESSVVLVPVVPRSVVRRSCSLFFVLCSLFFVLCSLFFVLCSWDFVLLRSRRRWHQPVDAQIGDEVAVMLVIVTGVADAAMRACLPSPNAALSHFYRGLVGQCGVGGVTVGNRILQRLGDSRWRLAAFFSNSSSVTGRFSPRAAEQNTYSPGNVRQQLAEAAHGRHRFEAPFVLRHHLRGP